MIRRIIHINEEKCNGCGACADACHESAIGMVNGKAKLLRDDYCDGLGDCLPACPTGAITFEEREAAAYDEAAVMANKQKKEASAINTSGSMRLVYVCSRILGESSRLYYDIYYYVVVSLFDGSYYGDYVCCYLHICTCYTADDGGCTDSVCKSEPHDV